ncbi:cyanophycin synthetase [filamentous cyanobacterium LEGE 11480]|uniref:Cyanophycin synthetase n=1 Tax=Romeriopsis navalis LEGE 11480 TaxID=2777977 RepID=A0A928VN61_9CYAN|nr:cyanophycin synthetase [Romeriopsis navalis]MBE9031678.1 cyanophycin synthetase [Romeriopsis navalis LEGE 11480]
MKILKTQTLRGPNYWSIRYAKLILVRLDLEALADRPSDTIDGFYEGLIKALPSLEEHFCSPGCRGGFLSRVREGTMMGHIMEHVAIELQTLAGMPVGFGRTRETATPGVYQVVFEYQYEEAGRYAARAAFRLCQSIVETGSYAPEELEKDLADLNELRGEAALGPSTEALVREAERREIPWVELPTRGMLQFGYGKYQQRVQASLTSHSSLLGVELACDKESTKQILGDAGVPVPQGTVIYALSDLEDAIDRLGGYPVVLKPLDGNHGRGITIDIPDWEQAEEAYDRAREVSKGVIVEHYYKGRDHRILVVNHKFVAVAERVPAHVVGNGKDTIAQLVDEENLDPRRGEGHDNILTQIKLDRTTDEMLKRQGYDLDTVLEPDVLCYLRATANLSAGGIAIDRTDEIHPETIWVAERVSRILGLDVAGIDVVTTDISQPMRAVNAVIVEVNAAPGLRMHLFPSEGVARNVAAPILDMLFPRDQPVRIPVIALTGTNGKTTTTRLITHIFRQVYGTVGFTTTDGIYINDHLVESGDTTGPQSAQVILQDPMVELAVLETARGGMLRSGLAFKHCDVGVVLNVAADHLGLGDINTLDDLAQLKAVVAESVQPNGYAVLNADDERVAAMADRVRSKVAYFSMDPDNPLVKDHVENGGVAAIYDKGYLAIYQQDWLIRIEKAKDLPLTMGGRAPFMIANALAASLAAFVQGIQVEDIRAALRSFRASAEQSPGRMNLFNLGRYHALVDYAHNPAGYEAVGSFVKNWAGPTIGVMGAPGDRRNKDFVELGKLAAQIFDQIIIKEDDDNRGRARGEVAELIVQGIEQELAAADRAVPYTIQLNEVTAIGEALDNAPENSLVVVLPESVSRAISLITARGPMSDLADAPQPRSNAPAASTTTAEPKAKKSPRKAKKGKVTADAAKG